ncbi:hypothetical protein KKA24_02285 [Patescibacteria group bacterium]|nr:hypothetical protein [Patescibacteria group bacterium]
MDEQLSKLKSQIDRIEFLKEKKKWGPDYQLWKKKTEKLVRDIFGEDELKLFQQQKTTTFSYMDDSYNQRQYLEELDNRKVILDGLLVDAEEYSPKNKSHMDTQKDILKEIWQKEKALKDNLLTTQEAQELQGSLFKHLEGILSSDSMPGLRFRKIKAEKKFQNWWSNDHGYPIDNPWNKIEPFLKILEQHEAEKTIKKRLEVEGLFVESRSQGEDQHLLIGKRDGTGEKAHVIIDGKSAEIRIEDTGKAPEELVKKIETFLTLPNGKKIRTSREILEEV